MGEIDLDFTPSAPVFDGNTVLGRRYSRYVRSDTVTGMLDEMDRVGVERALVYATRALEFDTREGNAELLEAIAGHERLVPQFVVNPGYDDLAEVAEQVREHDIRSVRLDPVLHSYPFLDWVVKPWLDWLESSSLPVWIAAEQVNPHHLTETLSSHPNLKVVVCELHFKLIAPFTPIARRYPNVYVELSRAWGGEGQGRIVDIAGADRVIYGSNFPDHPMGPHLYGLHQQGLSEDDLAAICSTNLERLLGIQ